MPILEDIVALVVASPSGFVNAKQAISKRLETLGARVASRWNKEVTHVVFQRRRDANQAEQAAEESELRSLYLRAEKGGFPVAFVSLLWVEACTNEQRRVMERRYAVPRPADNLFQFVGTPGSAAGIRKQQRRRSGLPKPVLPKPADHYDVDMDNPLYSSSQQIRGAATTGKQAEEVMSPMVHTYQKQHVDKSVAPDSGTGSELDFTDIGSGTQLAAEMLTGLGENLPSGAQQVLLGMNKAKGKRRNTSATPRVNATATPPIAKRSRRPKSALTPATTIGRARVSKKQDASSAPQLGRGTGSRRGGTARRGASRLQAAAAVIEAEANDSTHQDNKLALPHKRPRSARALKTAQREAMNTDQAAWPLRTDATAQGDTTAAIIASTSALNISQPIEDQQVRGRHEALQHASATGIGEPMPMEEEGTSAIEIQVSSANPGTSEAERARPVQRPSAAAETSTPELPAMQGPTRDEDSSGIPVPGFRRIPSPWVAQPSTTGKEKQQRGTQDLPSLGPWTQPRAWDRQRTQVQQGEAGELGVPGGAALHEKEDAGAGPGGKGPSNGCLALSSVDEGIPELAAAAVHQLQGLHLCPQGKEENITHLIITQERRTLKVLLAIANGAWLLSPAWLTASLEAGRWLPEAPFQAEVRFADAAQRARQHLQAVKERAPLLEGQRVYVHGPTGEKRGVPNNAPALRRMAVAIGAKIATRRDCTLCLLSGGVTTPSGLPPSAQVLREEWLLHTVATYSLPQDCSAWAP